MDKREAAAHWEANAEAWTARAGVATAAAEPYVADTRVAPLFLHLRGHKP